MRAVRFSSWEVDNELAPWVWSNQVQAYVINDKYFMMVSSQLHWSNYSSRFEDGVTKGMFQCCSQIFMAFLQGPIFSAFSIFECN